MSMLVIPLAAMLQVFALLLAFVTGHLVAEGHPLTPVEKNQMRALGVATLVLAGAAFALAVWA